MDSISINGAIGAAISFPLTYLCAGDLWSQRVISCGLCLSSPRQTEDHIKLPPAMHYNTLSSAIAKAFMARHRKEL